MSAVTIGELRGIITLSDQFSGPIDKVAKALGVSSESFKAVSAAAGLAVGTIGAATAAIVALGTRGAEVADVKGAFEGFAEAAGASADVMLGELQKGTLGTIANFDLMQLANKALGAGLIKSSKDMGTLAAGAQLLADRTGGDTKAAFETLTSAIASGRTAQLKQLGLFVDSKVAIEQYAASLGKSAGQLTDAERAQALSAGTLKKLNEELAKGGKAEADFGDNIQRAKVSVQNFVDSLGLAIATSPVVQAGMKGIQDALQAAFGGSQQETVQALTGFVNKFAIFLIDAAEVGVEAARFISNSWSGLKFLFNTIMEGVLLGLGELTRGVAELAELAAKSSLAPDWVKSFAVDARAASDTIQLMGGSFKQQAQDALDSAAENKVFFDTVQAGLTETRAAMVAAQGTQVELTQATRDFGAASTESATRSVESSTKIAENYRKLQQELALAQTEGIQQRLLQIQFAEENEIAALRATKDIKASEVAAGIELIRQRYATERDLLVNHNAEIRDRTLAAEQELALAHTTGLEQRLLQIEQAREREILGLEEFVGVNDEQLANLVALYEERYDRMRAVAVISQEGIAAAANDAGFQTRAQMQETADRAKQLYDEMVKSGKFTYDELQKAHAAMKKAEDELNGKVTLSAKQQFEILASSASTILRSMFGKSKAAAIAAALIDTAAAVAKALSAYPWPFNLAPAAAALAAGYAQVNQIRSTNPDGFRFGTDFDYQNFGRETPIMAHGPEAIVTKGQGANLAADVLGAVREGMRGGRGGDIVVHNVMQWDGRVMAEWWTKAVHRGEVMVTG